MSLAEIYQTEWEDVDTPHSGEYTMRLKVPGGWLYRVALYADSNDFVAGDHSKPPALAMTFVPEVPDV